MAHIADLPGFHETTAYGGHYSGAEAERLAYENNTYCILGYSTTREKYYIALKGYGGARIDAFFDAPPTMESVHLFHSVMEVRCGRTLGLLNLHLAGEPLANQGE